MSEPTQHHRPSACQAAARHGLAALCLAMAPLLAAAQGAATPGAAPATRAAPPPPAPASSPGALPPNPAASAGGTSEASMQCESRRSAVERAECRRRLAQQGVAGVVPPAPAGTGVPVTPATPGTPLRPIAPGVPITPATPGVPQTSPGALPAAAPGTPNPPGTR